MLPGEPPRHHRVVRPERPGQIAVRQPMDQFTVPKPPERVRWALEGDIAEERDELGKLSDGWLNPCLLPVDDGHLVNA